MLVFHAHWQAPVSPAGPGGFLFWAETSQSGQPERRRGRIPQNPKTLDHPFTASPAALQQALGGRILPGEAGSVVLRLPSTRTGPLPSPPLVHDWELDEVTDPFLAPWQITGLWLPVEQALPALLSLPDEGGWGAAGPVVLAAETVYWRVAAGLVLETLAAQKIAPVLAPAGGEVHARWLPVLDGPEDGLRLGKLERAMPPVCRAETRDGGPSHTSSDLLMNFLHTACDALARYWGAEQAPRFGAEETDPARLWLRALFEADPSIPASQAQLQALQAGQKAWLRNLRAAGDETFRIAFRLEAPQQQPGRSEPGWIVHFLLQARDDPSLLVPAETVWDSRSSVLNELDRRFEQPQEKLLAGLGYAARLFPPLAGSLKAKRPTHMKLDGPQAYAFLRKTAPLLQQAGFGLLAPPWWNKPGSRLGVHLRLNPGRKGSAEANAKSRLSFEYLVNYEWELSLGDTRLTEEEFRALAELKSPLVQIRGQWVQLDPEQIEAAIQFWQKQAPAGEFGLLDALDYAAGEEILEGGLPVEGIEAEGWVAEWLERLKRPEALNELPQPQGLHGELRAYQRYGYSWLHFLRRYRLGACLADDMGLGKTIQTIALLLKEKEILGALPAPSLLVCPTSVVTNWQREIERFAPALTTLLHQGSGRLRDQAFLEAIESTDLVLTSYALVRQDIDTLRRVSWLGVILDEAQNIKNPSAKQTQAARKLEADFRLALTGTPVENRLTELWSIMQFLNPGYLGSKQDFRSDYALPVERYGDAEAARRLKKRVGPLILRRVKTDPSVIQDLPEKIETKVYCQLTEEQATLYEAVVQDSLQQVEESEGVQRRGLVLSMLMQLKQICNHPVQYLHQGASGGTGSPQSDMQGRSGKLERLVELLEEVLAEGERALVFTQFAEMGALLNAYLPQATGHAAQFLHGGTPAARRDRMVRRFQEDEHAPAIFLLSLKAGGTGLNLTRASHVFHFDRWWNPAVEDQATDRAFRIGQRRNVQVHKFVTTGTVEEMIDDLIESKKELAEAVVGSGEAWLTELSTDQLNELVRLKRG